MEQKNRKKLNNQNFLILNKLAKSLFEQKTIDSLLGTLIKQLANILKAERTTFYFFNEEAKELWSYVANDLEIDEIRIGLGEGVAGHTALKRKIMNITDAGSCKFFLGSIDKRTGFKTKTILASPIINRDKKLLGVIQLINKENGVFTKEDELLLESISHYIVIALENIYLLQEQETLLRSTLYALSSAIDAKDPVTAGHSHRVAYYAVRLGTQLGYNEDEIKLLEYAAYLHDVGKIGIHDNVLQKKGKLTNEEFTLIRQHPIYTSQILRNIIFPSKQKDLPSIAAAHHEYLDGSGYPFKLKKNQISIFSRIITIADIFDALVSFDRPYKKNLSPKKALTILKEESSKNHIDPKLVNTFITKQLYKYEKRKYKRIDLNLSVKYSIIPQKTLIKEKIRDDEHLTFSDLTKNKQFKQKLQDISIGGLLFLVKQYLSIGTFLDLEINIEKEKFKLIGKIVWIEKISGTSNYKAGVSFINISSFIKKKLSKALKKIKKN